MKLWHHRFGALNAEGPYPKNSHWLAPLHQSAFEPNVTESAGQAPKEESKYSLYSFDSLGGLKFFIGSGF